MPNSASVRVWVTGAYCAFLCFDLIHSWKDDPFNSSGSPAFAIWGLALYISQRIEQKQNSNLEYPHAYLYVAISLSTLGTLGQLNIIQHLGLIVWCGGHIKNRPHQLFILLTSLSWIPLLGWLGNTVLQMNINFMRVPISLLVCLPLIKHRIKLNESAPPIRHAPE